MLQGTFQTLADIVFQKSERAFNGTENWDFLIQTFWLPELSFDANSPEPQIGTGIRPIWSSMTATFNIMRN